MTRKALLLVWIGLTLGGAASAELCTIDNVPAATLLLPYFEVGLTPLPQDPVTAARDVDTFFSVNNASDAPTVAHVVLWGDWSLPSIDFDIFLTGYDIETVSLSEVFNWGVLPITAHAWNDPDDLISPHGRAENDPGNSSGPHPGLSENPAWDSEGPPGTSDGCAPGLDCPRFPGCDTNLPLLPQDQGALTESLLDRLRCGHTGRGLECAQASCIGQTHDDGTGSIDFIARGYMTIDNVTDCNLLFPNQDGYFGTGLVSQVNQLWGDWFIVEEGRAIGDALVPIEASEDGTAFVAGDYTFYGRYVDGLATDQREPLGSTWATRYFQPNALFTGGSSLFVWRDSKCRTAVSGFVGDGCMPVAGAPPWWPLDETQVVAFDLQEDALQLCQSETSPDSGGISPSIPGDTVNPACFPLETGRYAVGDSSRGLVITDLQSVPYDFGWIYLNLSFTLGDTSGSPTPCSTDGLFADIAQSWVSTELDADGVLSVGYAGTALTSACSAANPLISLD